MWTITCLSSRAINDLIALLLPFNLLIVNEAFNFVYTVLFITSIRNICISSSTISFAREWKPTKFWSFCLFLMIFHFTKNIFNVIQCKKNNTKSTNSNIYVGLSLESWARNNSSFVLAIVLLNRDYIYKYKYDFYKV